MYSSRVMIVRDYKVTLLECPPGLFVFEGEVCFKSEHHSNLPDRMEVFCTSTGEVFWGGTDHWVERSELKVHPACFGWGD
jgi:hypothetical protein